MRFSSALLTALISMAALSVRADISITNPVAGTKWISGSSAVVEWRITSDEPSNPPVVIELRRGDAKTLRTEYTLTSTAKVNDKSFTWDVPSDIEAGKNYAILVKVNKKDFYSHMFEVADE
ncbi:hypothetical protein K7432_006231 [Basidiobolus ranarum]|uniref:Yeast cell wall synthesis Kre9/Knh1-like N-terminal domain-containing protein n=1 Tax=Basidiobolus ranarum TaxID=34480 RepID=A0ABR2WVA4_9FUNG